MTAAIITAVVVVEGRHDGGHRPRRGTGALGRGQLSRWCSEGPPPQPGPRCVPRGNGWEAPPHPGPVSFKKVLEARMEVGGARSESIPGGPLPTPPGAPAPWWGRPLTCWSCSHTLGLGASAASSSDMPAAKWGHRGGQGRAREGALHAALPAPTQALGSLRVGSVTQARLFSSCGLSCLIRKMG